MPAAKEVFQYFAINVNEMEVYIERVILAIGNEEKITDSAPPLRLL